MDRTRHRERSGLPQAGRAGESYPMSTWGYKLPKKRSTSLPAGHRDAQQHGSTTLTTPPEAVSSIPAETGPYDIERQAPTSNGQRQSTGNSEAQQEQYSNPTIDVPARLKILRGFPRTARFLAADLDKSWVMFRRFDETSIRNLLYLEARVAELEEIQKSLDSDDFQQHHGNSAVRNAARSYRTFALLGCDNREVEEMTPIMQIWMENRREAMEVLLKDKRFKDSSDRPLIEKHWEELQYLDEKDKHRDRDLLTPEAAILRRRKLLGYDSEGIRLVRQRWKLASELRKAVKEYEEALLRYRKLLKIEQPAQRTQVVVTKWISGSLEDPGNRQPQFLDKSMSKAYKPPHDESSLLQRCRMFTTKLIRFTWLYLLRGNRRWASPMPNSPEDSDDVAVTDRIGLGNIGSGDRLTRLVANITWLMELGKDADFEYPQISYTPERWLHRIVTMFVLWFAAVWVVGAVWFLWLMGDQNVQVWGQLILLTFFVATFGVALNFGTSASRDQIFGATAAYAAVLVVFIGTNSSNDASAGSGSGTNSTQQ